MIMPTIPFSRDNNWVIIIIPEVYGVYNSIGAFDIHVSYDIIYTNTYTCMVMPTIAFSRDNNYNNKDPL